MSKTGTKTPLRILVLPPVTRWKAELEDLRAAGHLVCADGWPHEAPDLIIGRAAWHMENAHRPYVKRAVEAAQARLKKKAKEAED